MVKFKSFVFAVLIISFLSGCAQTGTTLLNTLAKNDYKKFEDISYGSFLENSLDVYHPIKPSVMGEERKIVVFFYGGCWGQCTTLKKSDYLFVAQSLASQGFVVVMANFRQYPDVMFKEIMFDAANVIRWTAKNIQKFGGNANNIFVAGHSSGAHIASMLALDMRYLGKETYHRISGFIGLAGPYDFLPLDEEYQRELFDSKQDYVASQPINFVSSSSPPLLILHGDKDTTVEKYNALSLSKKAQLLGVDQQLITYPDLTHVSILTALSRPFQGRSTVLRDISQFIRQH